MTSTASQTDLHTLAHRFIDDVINARDFDGAMVDMVAEDFVELKPFPGQGPGRAGLADVLKMMVAGFPDLHWTLHDTIAEDDRVFGYSTWTGTHQGEFLGIPATGRPVEVEAWTIDRYRDGIFIESRIIMDVAALLGQLGALPTPE